MICPKKATAHDASTSMCVCTHTHTYTHTLAHSCVCMCNIFRQLQPFSAFQFNFKTAAIVVASHSSLSLFLPFALFFSSFFALLFPLLFLLLLLLFLLLLLLLRRLLLWESRKKLLNFTQDFCCSRSVRKFFDCRRFI